MTTSDVDLSLPYVRIVHVSWSRVSHLSSLSRRRRRPPQLTCGRVREQRRSLDTLTRRHALSQISSPSAHHQPLDLESESPKATSRSRPRARTAHTRIAASRQSPGRESPVARATSTTRTPHLHAICARRGAAQPSLVLGPDSNSPTPRPVSGSVELSKRKRKRKRKRTRKKERLVCVCVMCPLSRPPPPIRIDIASIPRLQVTVHGARAPLAHPRYSASPDDKSNARS